MTQDTGGSGEKGRPEAHLPNQDKQPQMLLTFHSPRATLTWVQGLQVSELEGAESPGHVAQGASAAHGGGRNLLTKVGSQGGCGQLPHPYQLSPGERSSGNWLL